MTYTELVLFLLLGMGEEEKTVTFPRSSYIDSGNNCCSARPNCSKMKTCTCKQMS